MTQTRPSKAGDSIRELAFKLSEKRSLLSLFFFLFFFYWGNFPGGASGKEPVFQCRRRKRHKFHLWVRKVPWRRAWQPTPVFLSGGSLWTEENGQLEFIGSQSRTWLKGPRTYAVLVSTVQQKNQSYLYIYTILFGFPSHSSHHYGWRFITLHRRWWSKPSPRKRNAKGKWLSEEALQTAE